MKKKIGFFGGDSQVGTSMIAQSTAECLHSKGNKILYIMGSGKLGNEFMTAGKAHSIDDLKANIISGRVLKEDIRQVIETNKGIHVIQSCNNPYTSKFFPENTYQVMFESISEEYDYVIIDGGDNVNLGLTVSGLNYCDERYFVITQQLKCIRRMMLHRRNILKPLEFDGKIVINKYVNDHALYRKKEIEDMIKLDVATTVPYIEYGWQAEIEERTLMHHIKFMRAIENISDLIEETEKKEKYGKGILFGRISQQGNRKKIYQ